MALYRVPANMLRGTMEDIRKGLHQGSSPITANNPDDRHSGFFATKEPRSKHVPRQREEDRNPDGNAGGNEKVKMDVVPSLGFRTWFLVSFRSMVPRFDTSHIFTAKNRNPDGNAMKNASWISPYRSPPSSQVF